MKRTYKLIASRGNEIVFDDRIQSDTPRNARNELKKLLGLQSLSGIVYSITEIPVELIREIVIHFRIASVGEVTPKLCHPFPVTACATTRFSGHARAVLFHNGTWGDWRETLRRMPGLAVLPTLDNEHPRDETATPVVRGLGAAYNNVTIDGSPIASPGSQR